MATITSVLLRRENDPQWSIEQPASLALTIYKDAGAQVGNLDNCAMAFGERWRLLRQAARQRAATWGRMYRLARSRMPAMAAKLEAERKADDLW